MLLAFLSTDCLGCASVWRVLDDPGAHRPPDDVDAVVVLRGKEGDLSERATGTDHALIAVSDDAWRDYSVLGYPTVVIIDRPTATVVAQSTVLDWTGVAPLFDAGR